MKGDDSGKITAKNKRWRQEGSEIETKSFKLCQQFIKTESMVGLLGFVGAHYTPTTPTQLSFRERVILSKLMEERFWDFQRILGYWNGCQLTSKSAPSKMKNKIYLNFYHCKNCYSYLEM